MITNNLLPPALRIAVLSTALIMLSGCVYYTEGPPGSTASDTNTTDIKVGEGTLHIPREIPGVRSKVEKTEDGVVHVSTKDFLGNRTNIEVQPDGQVKLSGKDFLGNQGKVDVSKDKTVHLAGQDFLGDRGAVDVNSAEVRLNGRKTGDNSGSGSSSPAPGVAGTFNFNGTFKTNMQSTGPVASGKVVTESRPVDNFSRIYNSTSADVSVSRGASTKLTVTGDSSVVSLIDTSVDGDTLTIQARKPFVASLPVKISIEVPHLRTVKLAGSGEFTAQALQEDSLELTLSGSTDAKVSGSARNLRCIVSGSGNANLGDFAVENAEVDVTGSGDVRVDASKELEADVSGSGSIKYSGGAKVRKRISGSGEVSEI